MYVSGSAATSFLPYVGQAKYLKLLKGEKSKNKANGIRSAISQKTTESLQRIDGSKKENSLWPNGIKNSGKQYVQEVTHFFRQNFMPNPSFQLSTANQAPVNVWSRATIENRMDSIVPASLRKVEGKGTTKGTGKETYQHLKDYKNNKYFTRSVEYNAGKDGTGFTYKVYQRGDINWDMVRTKGAKKGRGLTNAEASAKYGLAPILDEAGSVATLHHSQQKGVGPLYEASTRYHNIANAKRAPLHPYKGKLNPFYPMDETTRGAFQKVDSINYWKIRGEEALGGR
ncbi:hypothetical protein M1D49_12150 [Bacillus sp. PK3-056]|uniref:hypothetical protein n=1 Tax=Niallia circulans TaxID=1397 RepID=UPI00201E43D0|nr:hypothetical protein [Niallia circulans]